MGTTTGTTNEQQKTSIDPALKSMYVQNYTDALGVGQNITDYGPYQGQRVAGPTGYYDQGANMMAQGAQTLNRDMPANLAGQTLNNSQSWLNAAALRPYQQAGAYGYDPQSYYMQGATVDPSQQDIYQMDRAGIRDQTNPVTGREYIRDVNYQDFPRSLVRDVNGSSIGRGSVRDISADQILPGMAQYENRYTNDVIDRTTQDLDRARQIAMQQEGSKAVSQGAFGGGRHGVVEAETNRGFADAQSRMAAQERSNAFNVAAGLSGQDVTNKMQAGLANQGADVSMAQMAQNANLQAGQANQQADMNQAAMRQSGYLQAGQANQNADLNWSAQQLAGGQQAQAANQSMDFQAAMAKLNALNTGSSANADRRMQAYMANAGYGQQAGLSNMQAALDAQKFNAGNQQAADVTNQNAHFQNIQQMMAQAAQGQSLAQQQYQMPMDAAQKMMQLDQYSRGMTNEQIQAQMQQWDDERYRQLQALQLQGAAVGMNLPNLGMSSTGTAKTTQQPSLGQNLGQLAGIAGMFM